MDKQSEEMNPGGGISAATRLKLVFRGAWLGSFLMLAIGSALIALLAKGQDSTFEQYLRTLALLAAWCFSLAGWGLFFLDSMCGILGLAQARVQTLAIDFILALLSLVPLALVLVSQRLAAGFGP